MLNHWNAGQQLLSIHLIHLQDGALVLKLILKNNVHSIYINRDVLWHASKSLAVEMLMPLSCTWECIRHLNSATRIIYDEGVEWPAIHLNIHIWICNLHDSFDFIIICWFAIKKSLKILLINRPVSWRADFITEIPLHSIYYIFQQYQLSHSIASQISQFHFCVLFLGKKHFRIQFPFTLNWLSSIC